MLNWFTERCENSEFMKTLEMIICMFIFVRVGLNSRKLNAGQLSSEPQIGSKHEQKCPEGTFTF